MQDSSTPGGAPAHTVRVILSGFEAPNARRSMHAAGVRLAAAPEALALAPTVRDAVLAAGADTRGLVYTTLELADRVATADGDPLAALRVERPILQRPANASGSRARMPIT